MMFTLKLADVAGGFQTRQDRCCKFCGHESSSAIGRWSTVPICLEKPQISGYNSLTNLLDQPLKRSRLEFVLFQGVLKFVSGSL